MKQIRARVLTGSIGLEGPWSEWMDWDERLGAHIQMMQNREYQYRPGPSEGNVLSRAITESAQAIIETYAHLTDEIPQSQVEMVLCENMQQVDIDLEWYRTTKRAAVCRALDAGNN